MIGCFINVIEHTLTRRDINISLSGCAKEVL
nr:MAG TPA: hypothetical protein [Caudoviricetes sp.]